MSRKLRPGERRPCKHGHCIVCGEQMDAFEFLDEQGRECVDHNHHCDPKREASIERRRKHHNEHGQDRMRAGLLYPINLEID